MVSIINNQTTELLPCPFCGGEASKRMFYGGEFGIYCDECSARVGGLYTEAEAIAAWNSRAPIEYDGWFYLPKPKEGIVDYGEPEITRTENGYKVRQIADVVDEAARRWGDELGEYAMKRICEAWNSRAERMCAQCAKDMGAYADSLCDPLKERVNELLRCLENDWHIRASWDGLRKFWNIELTDEGVRLRDAELNSRAERTCHRVLDSELASKPGWHIKHRCSECGEKLNDVNYCPNCGRKCER